MKTDKELKEIRKLLQDTIKQVSFCWLCGREDNLTDHHVIPQMFKGSKFNLTIPICTNCNSLLHLNDEIMTLLRRIYRIRK